MVEPEMAYYDLDMNMDLAEEFVEYIVQRTLERRKEVGDRAFAQRKPGAMAEMANMAAT